MSTSDSPLGECLVCGKESSTRCGECSAYGTKYMFFCGPKHQRLVWFLHKRFCGSHSNPFRFPALSKEEVNEFTEMSRKKSTLGPSWQEQFVEGHFPTIETDLAQLVFIGYLNELHSDVRSPELQKQLIICRATAFQIRNQTRDQTADPLEDLLSNQNHPIDYFANQLTEPGIPMLPGLDAFALRSELYHRFLCVVAVSLALQRKKITEEDPVEMITARAHTMRTFYNFLELRIKPIRPDIVRAFDRFI